MALRVVFFGTAELACASLEALTADPRFLVTGVVTQPDKPRGRDMQVQPSAVKVTALKLGVPVLQPKRARDPGFIAEVQALVPDVGVVVAYGQILPQTLLDVPRHGFVNVHTSILPRHRGAAPIQWAILSGDAETGVTIMQMDAGLDTGPILAVEKTPIQAEDDSRVLHDRLARMGAELLVRTLPEYTAGRIAGTPQPAGATYARKIEKADGRIDWNESAETIQRKLRAFTPWPGAFCFVEGAGGNRLLKVWRAEAAAGQAEPGQVLVAQNQFLVGCGAGALRLIEVQPEGRKRMTGTELLAGHAVTRLV
jgi:methionyl-tRNA formyltransferase